MGTWFCNPGTRVWGGGFLQSAAFWQKAQKKRFQFLRAPHLTRRKPADSLGLSRCGRSTMDSVAVSEAVDVGSIPAARTTSPLCGEKRYSPSEWKFSGAHRRRGDDAVLVVAIV